ncbi:MAG: type II toxin-antitoxin system VapC family toxin [Sphingomonadales bacterium]|nr:type II toxin-antitoxin system VapC family toxin [Sphingomonadales bacterium]
MVIDSSAVLAILQDEPERRQRNEPIAADPVRLLSAASCLEVGNIIGDRLGYEGARDLRYFLSETAMRIVPVTEAQAELARDAYRRYGRGNHPAALSFGDCFAYALAKTRGERLLFKGEDFTKTDIESHSS